MELPTFWFILIAFLWTGYFVLEGFDFGVGALLPVLSRDEAERRQVLATIGPVWDGNEVWVITAVGAMFAAFPSWYAGLLSGFYLPLLMVLAALIVRGVGLEWRSKVRTSAERALCDAGIVTGSFLPAFMWGAIFGNLLGGTPLATITGGLFSLTIAALHGAIFVALKTDGPARARARRTALLLATAAVPSALAALPGIPASAAPLNDWATHPTPWIVSTAAMATLAAAVALIWRRREGWAFTATAITITLATTALFTVLWESPLPGLTLTEAASGPYTLTVMTWIGAAALPFVLAYQTWTYWTFRKRLAQPTVHV
ncbi:cytochrome d ubiquinol oxidase subunit II [Thermopolyspora sp. NPDC052614]|uniref:cytochrome d ubiquinol oxidase subunit II n=1 Tax=Thermopolyspora sp. NPDC052614 TaxID=3155682 RepID=UPI0034341A13